MPRKGATEAQELKRLLGELRELARATAADRRLGPMEREHRLSTLDAIGRTLEAEGVPHAQHNEARAAQFKPFAALRGYEEEVAAREHTVEPRRTMTEERARELRGVLAGLGRGDIVEVVAYGEDGYETHRGPVRQVVDSLGWLRLEDVSIKLDDIWSVTTLD